MWDPVYCIYNHSLWLLYVFCVQQHLALVYDVASHPKYPVLRINFQFSPGNRRSSEECGNLTIQGTDSTFEHRASSIEHPDQ